MCWSWVWQTTLVVYQSKLCSNILIWLCCNRIWDFQRRNIILETIVLCKHFATRSILKLSSILTILPWQGYRFADKNFPTQLSFLHNWQTTSVNWAKWKNLVNRFMPFNHSIKTVILEILFVNLSFPVQKNITLWGSDKARSSTTKLSNIGLIMRLVMQYWNPSSQHFKGNVLCYIV